MTNRTRTIRSIAIPVVAATLALGLAACSDDDDDSPDGSTPAGSLAPIDSLPAATMPDAGG